MNLNEIYLGNAYELIKQVPDKSVDLIVTDPPYEIKGLQTGTGIFKDRSRGLNHYVNQMLEAGLDKGIDLKILDEFVRVMKKINIYLWCNKEQIYDYLTYFVKERKCNWEMLIWAKDNPPPFTNGHYLKDKEYCLFFWEKGVKVNINRKSGKTVYVTKTNVGDKSKYKHPTIKPIDIIETLIKNSSNVSGGGLVFDPFVGSGTTCLAAKHLGLNYLGFEINEKYYNIAKDRLSGIDQNGEMNLFDL